LLIMIVAVPQGKAASRERSPWHRRRGDALILRMMVYSALLTAVLVLGAPYWLVRMLTGGRYRAGLAGRLGRLPDRLRAAVAEREVIWLHAVSVGEVLAATRLIEELKLALPGVVVAVSTTTETGQELAQRRFPEMPVFYLPLDFAFLMKRTLRVLRPRLVVLMESELWPNMIQECARAGVPMAVVNARISDRSFPRYLRLRRLWRPLLEQISMFLAQSEETAERLLRIGVRPERVQMTGNLKYDVQAEKDTAVVQLLRYHLPANVRVLLCGSTLEGEETLLLAAWREIAAALPQAVLIVAPRHPARFAAVDTLLRETKRPVIRASGFVARPEAIPPGGMVLLDTIGDLATACALADVVFIGGSLVPLGGHNPLEPAQFGVPVVMGRSYENFREIVEAMRAEEAIRIVSAEELGPTLAKLLRDPAEARALGDRGRRVFTSRAGATRRVVEELMRLLR